MNKYQFVFVKKIHIDVKLLNECHLCEFYLMKKGRGPPNVLLKLFFILLVVEEVINSFKNSHICV